MCTFCSHFKRSFRNESNQLHHIIYSYRPGHVRLHLRRRTRVTPKDIQQYGFRNKVINNHQAFFDLLRQTDIFYND